MYGNEGRVTWCQLCEQYSKSLTRHSPCHDWFDFYFEAGMHSAQCWPERCWRRVTVVHSMKIRCDLWLDFDLFVPENMTCGTAPSSSEGRYLSVGLFVHLGSKWCGLLISAPKLEAFCWSMLNTNCVCVTYVMSLFGLSRHIFDRHVRAQYIFENCF